MLAQQKVLNLNIEIIRKNTPKCSAIPRWIRCTDWLLFLLLAAAQSLGDGIGGFGWCFLVWRDGGWLIMVGKGAAEMYGCVGRSMEA